MNNPKLTRRSVEVIAALFADNSNLQLPVGVSEQVIEIRLWARRELENAPAQATPVTEETVVPIARRKGQG